jgi:hypothetical protein
MLHRLADHESNGLRLELAYLQYDVTRLALEAVDEHSEIIMRGTDVEEFAIMK